MPQGIKKRRTVFSRAFLANLTVGRSRYSGMTSLEMVHASPRSGRLMQRFLLMAMLGLALASRLALGATVPAQIQADQAHMSATARLQAAMVMCDPGQSSKAPPSTPYQKTCADDLLVWDLADQSHVLPGAPPLLPQSTTHWVAAAFTPAFLADAPVLYGFIPQPRGPPASV